MKYPFTSLTISILFWLVIFVLLAWFLTEKNQQLVKVVNIDANLIREEKSIVEKEKTSQVKTNAVQTNSQANQNQSATIINRPLPKIPDDLRREAFESYAIARFHIAADGSFTVELIKPCANPRLNFLLLQSLKQWKFEPEKKLGISVNTTKDIRVDFKVE